MDTIVTQNPLALSPDPGRRPEAQGRILVLVDMEDMESRWKRKNQAGGKVYVDVLCPSDPAIAERLAKTFVTGPQRAGVTLLDEVTARIPVLNMNQAQQVTAQLKTRTKRDSDSPADLEWHIRHMGATDTQLRELSREKGGGAFCTVQKLHGIALDAGNAPVLIETIEDADGLMVGFSAALEGYLPKSGDSDAVAAAEARVTVAEEHVTTLQERIEDLKADLRSARARATRLATKVGKLEAELEAERSSETKPNKAPETEGE